METRYSRTPVHNALRAARLLLPACALILLAVRVATAQELVAVGNSYVTASVVSDNASNFGGGRFVIDAGPFYSGYKFLYSITSFVVFKVRSNGQDFYYTNAKDAFGGQPTIDGVTAVPFKPFDSLYSSADTIAVTWKNLNGYTVTMRMIPERPRTIYDRGSDVLIEFSHTFDPNASGGDLGIYMMLDTYNGQASATTGGSGDKSSVLTSRGYFPSDGPGKLFTAPFDPIPDFYHVGNFLYSLPLNDVLPIHRLKGFSHGGVPLTTPELFAIGDWHVLRNIGWNISSSDVASRAIGDCATAMRWSGLRGDGTVRTAFGMDDKPGNDIFHCRDSKLFVDIKSERLVEQKVQNGAYTPAKFDITMWVTNTDMIANTATITFATPIGAPNPALMGRLLLDASTPSTVVVPLGLKETKEIHWIVNVAPSTNDSLIDIPLDFRYQLTGTPTPRVFKLPCTPTLTIKGYRNNPPPQDTIAPQIDRGPVVRTPKPGWNFKTYDRHPGYLYDTGLDKIVIERNDVNNFVLIQSPASFTQCNTAVTLDLLAQVVDSTRPGYIVFAVYDCKGHITRDSAIYNPRPDIFSPKIDRMIFTGTFDTAFPCNNRLFDYYLIDSLNQTSTAGDNGFGLITVLGPLDNFDPIEVNFNKSDIPIKDFDPRASFRLKVTDSMFDAVAQVRVVDYAGNADTIEVKYCTLPDTKAPVGTVVGVPNPIPGQGFKAWNITATDSDAWDRGLESVVVLSNVNMQYTDPGITPGDRVTSFPVSVVLDSMDAQITLEIRDRYYPVPGHADTITLTFAKIPDTLAPNINPIPRAGTNGSQVDVDVNDVHFFGASKYLYDRGLLSVNIISMSSNIRLLSPTTAFATGDANMTFAFEVIDTLALTKRDSICIEAIDVYGNRSEGCYVYPLQPDANPPILLGSLDNGHTAITATMTDSRQYDRGLGSVTLEKPVNLDPTAGTKAGLNGIPSTSVSVPVTDPTKEISGTFVVRDLIAESEPTPETELHHAVRVPFRLPSVKLSLDLPMIVERGGDIKAAVVAADSFPGDLVHTIRFVANYGGDALYSSAVDKRSSMSVATAGGMLDVTCTPMAGTTYYRGDTLGVLIFKAHGSNMIDSFSIVVDAASLKVNDNIGMDVMVQVAGDTAISLLKLPAPYFNVAADSLTFINGICQRILSSLPGGRSKINGLSILGVKPQPVPVSAGGTIDLDVRDLPVEGASVDLVSTDGRKVASFSINGTGAKVTRVSISLPQSIPSGTYSVQLSTATERTWTKVVVVQ
jgi:hypothetical protein